MDKSIDESIEEKELLQKVVQKDSQAFEQLYRKTAQSVFHFLFRMLNDKQSAEDVQIEVFTQVWTNADKFMGKSRVRTWIFGIARNLALNELRKKKLNVNSEYIESLPDEKKLGDYENLHRQDYIHQALSSLSDKHREILDLVFFHELNYTEISEVLDIPENTVKTRVFYAKAAIKEKILQMES